MSYTELHTGKLKMIAGSFSRVDLENFISENPSLEIPDYEEQIDGDFITVTEKGSKRYNHYKFVLHKGKFYQMVEHEEREDLDYLDETVVDNNGDVKFSYIFYNGGTCFSEMLEEGLDKIKNEL